MIIRSIMFAGIMVQRKFSDVYSFAFMSGHENPSLYYSPPYSALFYTLLHRSVSRQKLLITRLIHNDTKTLSLQSVSK